MYPGIQFPAAPRSSAALSELDLLFQISQVVHSVDSSRERFLEVMRILDEAFGRRFGTLTLWNQTRERVLLEVTFGDLSQEQKNMHGLDPSLIRGIMARRQPMAISRIDQRPIPIHSRNLLEKEAVLLCVPVMNGMHAVGVVGTNPMHGSVEKDFRLLDVIACMAFKDAPLPADEYGQPDAAPTDPPLDEILEGKLKQMIKIVDLRTESRYALLPDIISLVEKIVIKWALKKNQNVQIATAHFLGINRNTLRKKMRDLNIHS